jgi:integrase
MAHSPHLLHNRHGNTWHGRVVIPHALRPYFQGQREIRRSLHTCDKRLARRRARQFWLHCQEVFDAYRQGTPAMARDKFEQKKWLSEIQGGHPRDVLEEKIVTIEDVLGGTHHFDLGDPDKELDAARQAHERATALLERYQDDPVMLDRLFRIDRRNPDPARPKSPTPFNVTVDLYLKKLETQGRKGKKLAPRTLLDYRDKLGFWQAHFGERLMHSLAQDELAEIQRWLPCLPASFAKKGLSAAQAVKQACAQQRPFKAISDKTRALYLSQLRGVLEYAWACGFIQTELAPFIEIPNTKQSQEVARLPFSPADLCRIFPGQAYGVDFGHSRQGIAPETKFWFPLFAVFTGARLEELAQLKVSDIRTEAASGITYAMIDNRGTAADGGHKRTKNRNSVRQLPLHPMLRQIGFDAYLAERRQAGREAGLFKLNRDRQGRLAKGVSDWFSRYERRANRPPVIGYIERRGVISKGAYAPGQRWTKTFHSFRHTVIDNLRGSRLANGEYIRELDIALVMGHDREKLETASYGTDRTQLALRQAVIEAIAYPDVPFGEISWEAFKANHLKAR